MRAGIVAQAGNTSLNIGSSPVELTNRSTYLFATEVMPHLRPIWSELGSVRMAAALESPDSDREAHPAENTGPSRERLHVLRHHLRTDPASAQ
jgi:hypothetical protein